MKYISAFAMFGFLFANDFCQGDILPDNCYRPGYNASAKIDLGDRGCLIPNDVFAELSFIYWYACQDGMGLAASADLKTSGEIVFNQLSTTLTQDFEYKSGFKIGLGAGFQDWEFHAKYAWIRQKTHVNEDAPTKYTNGRGNIPVWLVNTWFAQRIGAFSDFVSATNLGSSWKLGIDWLDLTASRPYYEGKKITIQPYGGLRALWIRQSLVINATVPAAAVSGSSLAPEKIYSRNQSHARSLGPVFGGSGHFLLGTGFRVEGDGAFGILFTRYTKLSHKENSAVAGTTPKVFRAVLKNYNTVRPVANLGLGVGWGQYFCNCKFHIDFSADYEFSALWNQNMLRTFAEEFAIGSAPSNDLFLQGLTVTGRLDF